jgi:hypothetical protein
LLFEAAALQHKMTEEGINVNNITDRTSGLRLVFPDSATEARARAEEFRQLSPEDRWLQISQLMELGLNMVRDSPRRAEIEQRMAAQEREWQLLQTELFRRHAR